MKKIRVWAIKRHVWVMKKKKRSVGIQEWIEKMNDCGPRTHEDQAKKTKKKEQLFVRPMMMMTLVVPIFFPPRRHFPHFVTIWRALEVKEKRDDKRDAQRRSTPKSANRFERNPHFCVGARAREVAREVAWTRKRLERKNTSRLRERGTPVDLERHFESRIGEKARGKEGRSKVRAIVFCNARPRARARKKSARRIATSSRSISRGATDENALFVRARKRDIFFSLRCGWWQRVR